jgi:uncharacterized protein (DUF488 family)
VSDQVTLYTIGYEGRTLSQFVRTLKESGVERVVDVRLTPSSRVRGFSLMSLFAALRKEGITYEHVAKLGNPPEIRELFHRGDIVDGRKQYRRLLNNGRAAYVDYVVGLAKLHPTAILCREADAARCHRAVVAEVAKKRADVDLAVEDL